jgi:hypothetical protein
MCGEELEMHHPKTTLDSSEPSFMSLARCGAGPCRLGTVYMSIRRLFPVWADGMEPATQMVAIPPDPPSPIARLLFRCSGIRACCYASGDGGTKRAFHVCRAIPEATRVAKTGPQKLSLSYGNRTRSVEAMSPEQAMECRVLPHCVQHRSVVDQQN